MADEPTAPPNQGEVTKLLVSWRKNQDPAAFNQLIPLVYTELHRIARSIAYRYRDGSGGDQTMGPTAIVQQAYLKLVDQHGVDWKDRAHFLSIAAREMRRILIDYWRYKNADLRGGGMEQVALENADLPVAGLNPEAMALNQALERLAEFDNEAAQVIELRYFGGMTVDEVAEVLQLGRATVERRERHAKAWIRTFLSSGHDQ